jgi:hypothetical protein
MRQLSVIGLVLCACGAEPVPAPDAGDDPGLGDDIAAIPAGCLGDRATEDRRDDHGFDQIRVLYVIPADGVDRALDTSGQICNSVRAIASWFHAQTGAHLRWDTAGGLVDIGFVRLTASDAEMRGNDPGNATIATGIAFVRERIERAMAPLAPNKLYAVYYDGTSSYSCGGGAWPPLIVGRVGAMYLAAQPPGQAVPCGDSRPWGRGDLVPGYIDYGMLHELVHSLGLAPDTAPNEHSTGHVFDESAAAPNTDLMYSQRPGRPDPFWAVDDPAGLVLDLGGDDYAEELASSSIVAPLPDDAHRPIGW